MVEYAVYKGDELLGIGNARELSKKLNVKERTVYFWTSPANKRRNEKCGNRIIAIKVED
jgi:hypothetical protein